MFNLAKIEKEKSFIKEIFPFLNNEDIENLFVSSEDMNIIITKILDNNYKGINVNLKDITQVKKIQKQIKKDLYYPELFYKQETDVYDGDIDRRKAEELYSQIKLLKNKLNFCKDKRVLEYQSEEIQQMYEELDKLNRKRALMILSKSLLNAKNIDLHGLYTKEALMFLSDYIQMYCPKEINLITGRDGNSQSLRPSVINFLENKGFKVVDKDNPYVRAVKRF